MAEPALTEAQTETIRAALARMTLPSGLGSKENACSIAAINLALTGELTDEIPECMSLVIGRWIIPTQDGMPKALRNSARWKSALVRAAGTGRDLETEHKRLGLILDHMWSVALPILQPLADANGFGGVWRDMTEKRTLEAAEAAAEAVETSARAAARATVWATVWAAARAAAEAAAAEAAAVRAEASAWASVWAARAAAAAENENAWETLDPCGLLESLVEI